MVKWNTDFMDDERRFYRSQIDLADNQIRILKGQKKLNDDVASATIVLAIAAFLNIIFTITNEDFSLEALSSVGFLLGTFFAIGIISLIVLMAALILKIVYKKS